MNWYNVRVFPRHGSLFILFQHTTDQHRNEALLEASEKKYRMLVEAATFPIFAVDYNGTYQFMNTNASSTIGGAPENYIGKTMFELFPLEIADKHMKIARSVIKNKKPVNFEDKTLINQQFRWFESNMQPIIDTDGSCRQVLILLYDTTDRHRAIDALTKSEQRYRLLFTEMYDAFALHEMIFDDFGEPCDFRYLEVNPAYERLIGLSAGDIVGKTVLELFPEFDSVWIREYGAVAVNGEPIHFEFNPQPDVYQEFTAFSPQKGQFGVIVKDMTERRLAEIKLIKSEQQLKEAQRIARVGHWEFDVIRNEALWSEETYRLHGVSEETRPPVGEEIFTYVHEEDAEYVRTHFNRCLSEAAPMDIVYRYRMPSSDEIKYFRSLAHPVADETGAVVRLTGTVQDVTEQHLAREALETSELKLREALRMAHLGSWEYDLRTKESYWSDELYRIYGLAPEFYIPEFETVYEFMHPDDVKQAREATKHTMKTGEPHDIHFRICLPGMESTRYIHAIGKAERDASGAIIRLTGTVQDVTEQQLAQEALRHSEQKLREAQKMAHMGNWEFNPLTKQAFWSDEAYRLHGLEPDDGPAPLGDEFIALIFADDRQTVRTCLLNNLEIGEEIDVTYRVAAPETQTIRYLHSIGKATLDAGGKTVLTTGTVQDVTDQRLAQQALHESAEQYKALFKNSGTISLIIDAETGIIVDANNAAVAFYGYSYEKLCGMNIGNINMLPPEEIKQKIALVSMRGQTHFEFKHRLASGEARHVEVYSGPVMIRGKAHLFSVVFDITEQKQLEHQFIQAQRMETIGRLAGGIAHDFNNLLTVITGNAELILTFMEPKEKYYSEIEEIKQSADRAAGLTRQLLAFSRRQIIEPVVVNINTILVDMNRMLRRLIGENIQFVALPADDLWPVRIDPGQVEQVITNLVVNARDAMPEGGKLTIETVNTPSTKPTANVISR